jgi:hypothetical protein
VAGKARRILRGNPAGKPHAVAARVLAAHVFYNAA